MCVGVSCKHDDEVIGYRTTYDYELLSERPYKMLVVLLAKYYLKHKSEIYGLIKKLTTIQIDDLQRILHSNTSMLSPTAVAVGSV